MKRLLYIVLLLPLLSHGQLNLDDNQVQLDSGRIVTTQGTIDSYDFRVLFIQTKQRVITNTVTETTFFNDTDDKLCIFDNGSGVTIRNRLGDVRTIKYIIHH